MPRLLIVTQGKETLTPLCDSLIEYGFSCMQIEFSSQAEEVIATEAPDVVLVEMDRIPSPSGPWGFIKSLKNDNQFPVIALIPRKALSEVKNNLQSDDFITTPFDSAELILRVNQLLHRKPGHNHAEVITSGGMVIDLASCDVTIFGKRVELTFREYELLKFLASNKGRVFSRDELLNRVWGFDFFGGDRTVDTHIRRLRSKTEDQNNSYIETVRNIGYRFKADRD